MYTLARDRATAVDPAAIGGVASEMRRRGAAGHNAPSAFFVASSARIRSVRRAELDAQTTGRGQQSWGATNAPKELPIAGATANGQHELVHGRACLLPASVSDGQGPEHAPG